MRDQRETADPDATSQAQTTRYDELRVRKLCVRTRVADLRDKERSMRETLAFLESKQAILTGYRETYLRETESTKENST